DLLLAVDDDFAFAPADTTPRDAPCRELANRFWRGVDEHPHYLLIRAPVAAAHRIFEVHVLVVALRLDHVRKRCLHATLRGSRMRPLRRHERKDDHVVPSAFGADAQAQSGETAADHEHVGIDDFHFLRYAGT